MTTQPVPNDTRLDHVPQRPNSTISSYEAAEHHVRIFHYRGDDVPKEGHESDGWENDLLAAILAWAQANPLFKIQSVTLDGDMWIPPSGKTPDTRLLQTLGFREPYSQWVAHAVVTYSDVSEVEVPAE